MYNKLNNTKIPHLLECLYVSNSTFCNLRCQFCASEKCCIEKKAMKNELFCEVIEKAVDFGFNRVNLTPIVGEPLTDKHFIDKLLFLENHSGIEDYYFCTNLILANQELLNQLSKLKKLSSFSISVYGHNEETFKHLTKGSNAQYINLLSNLNLLNNFSDLLLKTELRLRTINDFEINKCQSGLCQLIKNLQQKGARLRTPKEYQNWTGMVDKEELEDLGLLSKTVYPDRSEPCVFLFFKHTVLPDGLINACSAADVGLNHIIGNLQQNNFKEIYSKTNQRYLELIDSQLNNDFNDHCQKCTAYRPLSNEYYSYKFHKREFITLNELFERLNKSEIL